MLIVIRGPLGAGKTRVAGMLAKRLRASHILLDDVLRKHHLDAVPKGARCIPLRNFLQATTIIFPAVKRCLEGNQGMVIDGCFYHKGQLDDLRRRVSRLQGKPSFLVFTLRASLHTCVRRNAGRKQAYGKDAAAAVHALVTRFDAGRVIGTDGKAARQVVDAIMRSLHSC